MLLKRSKMIAVAGLYLLLAVSFGFADFLIDDFNDQDNKNEIGTYWYFYNDNDPGGTSEVLNDPFEDAGVNADGVAVMEYSLGDSVDKDDYMLYPFVGVGFNFIGEGTKPYDLTGATAISFDIWADKAMKVKFLVETSDLKSSDDKLHSILEVGKTKEKKTVLLTIDKTLPNALKQEGWGTPKIKTYDPTTNLKIAFQLRGHPDENPTFGKGTSGKLYIDNFTIVGPVKIKKWAELDTVAIGTYKSTDGLLADFSEDEPTINRLAGEWFIYNDEDNGGTSKFTKGFDPDDEKKFIADEAGGAGGTAGVSMAFELGPKLATDEGDSILPYVGIGCNILKGGRKGYNAKGDGATGLYLEYKSNIYVNIELEDTVNRGSGVVYHAVLPPTGAKWAGVKIPFDSLKLQQWVTGTKPELATNNLKKIQFKLSDGAIKEGNFAFDNLYFTGAKFTGVIARHQRLMNNDINVNQTGNVLKVMFNNMRGVDGANVSLINTIGRVVASKSINMETMSCILPLYNNASGIYLLKISVNGIVKTAPIHIFR
jgi:hypothetical protein